VAKRKAKPAFTFVCDDIERAIVEVLAAVRRWIDAKVPSPKVTPAAPEDEKQKRPDAGQE
jgi:hypothetical protein